MNDPEDYEDYEDYQGGEDFDPDKAHEQDILDKQESGYFGSDDDW